MEEEEEEEDPPEKLHFESCIPHPPPGRLKPRKHAQLIYVGVVEGGCGSELALAVG